jgi:hypothetical protein
MSKIVKTKVQALKLGENEETMKETKPLKFQTGSFTAQ